MKQFEPYLNEGFGIIEQINHADSVTSYEEPRVRQTLESIVQRYGPRNPVTGEPIDTHNMPTQNLQKIAKNAVGAIHYHKVFKELPDKIEELWKNVSKDLGRVFAYTRVAKDVAKLGETYGIKGKMDKEIKEKIGNHIKTLDDLKNGKANDETVEKIANEFADTYMVMLERTVDKKDPISEQEKRDYRTLIVNTLKDNKEFGAMLMANSYAPTVEKMLEENEGAILTYTKNIAEGVHKEGPGNLDRNYEKFIDAGTRMNRLYKEVAMIREEHAKRKNAKVPVISEEAEE